MTTSAYAQIPPDRPATLDALASLYGPVAEYQARQYYIPDNDRRRSLDDLRQDAWEGIVRAWHTYDPAKGMTFKIWAVNMARWYVLNGVKHVDANLHNSWIYDRDAYNRLLRGESLEAMADGLGDHLAVMGVEDEPDLGPSMDGLLALLDDPRLRHVVDRYYCHGETLEVIGLGLEAAGLGQNVCRERVRQLLEKSYMILRRKLKSGPVAQNHTRRRGPGRKRKSLLHQLADMASVTTRTIRHWIAAYGILAVARRVKAIHGEHGVLLPVPEAAARMGIATNTVYNRIKDGRLAGVQVFTVVRVPESEVADKVDLACNSGLGL